jgi:MFS family permease
VSDANQVVDVEAASASTAALAQTPASVCDSIGSRGQPASAGPRHSRLGVLRHRHFRNVWLGALVSNIGGWMEGVGVQWIIAHTTGSAYMMAWLAVAQLGPTMVLGMLGGIAADRVNRKKLLLFTQGAMMVIAAALALASYLGRATPTVLLALSLLQGITLAFNTPAWQVLTPRLVSRDELTEAISLNGLQFNLARVVGPALAGVLMAYTASEHNSGATPLFVVNTVSFLFVLVAIAGTPDSPAPPRTAASVLHQTKEALAFVFHGRGPRAVFVGMVTFAVLAAPMMRMLPLFAKEVYAETDPVFRLLLRVVEPASVREVIFSIFLAVIGAGAVVGAIGIRWIPRWYPKHHFIPLSILLSGMSTAAFSGTRSLVIAIPMLFLGGIFWLWAFNSAFAAMQLLVPDSMRGRAMSLVNMAVFGAMPLGTFLAGLVGEAAQAGAGPGSETQLGVGVLGAVLAVAGLVMLIWRTPEVDGMRPGETGYQRQPGLLNGILGTAHRPGSRRADR